MMDRVRLANLPRLRHAMEVAGVDAVLAASPENFLYLSGARILSQVLIRTRLAIAVLQPDGTTSLIVNSVEREQTALQTSVPDIRTYSEFLESPMEVLAELLREKGLDRASLGVESQFLTAAYLDGLAARLPKGRLIAADEVFDFARMVKSPSEIEALRFAARGTDEAIGKAISEAHAGDPEHTLARSMSDALFEIGAGEFRDISWGVASGPNIAVTHYWAGDRRLVPGEFVRINVRASYRGYYSHLYRRAVVRKASKKRTARYERARDIHHRSIQRLRPGARACDLYEAAKEDMAAVGIPFSGAHIGHSTGLALHENPRLQPLDTTVLEPGMVIAAEPTVPDPDDFAYHLEDLVLVTDDSPVVLSDVLSTDELPVIGAS